MKPRSVASLLAAATVLAALPALATADTALLENPNWNITLSDFGYSDLLLDNTPGLVGREYLSGEWAAAVSYQRLGQSYTPTWLEPNFIFPDWITNSNFSVVTPIASTGTTASSVIASSHLRVAIGYQMIDTVTGMKLGTSKASAAAGSSIDSNRYVLKQTYTITNISGEDITNLNVFQMLHSLEAGTTLFDNRVYNAASGAASPLGAYRYDITQLGQSTTTSSTDGTPITLLDYISFAGSVAPVAVDSGWYGSDDPLSPYYSDHATTGKPLIGVHLNIENNALSGADYFTPPAPATMYVAGAQKWSLGILGDGNSVSLDVVLSIKTGTVSTPAPDGSCDGSANGGKENIGGVDYHFTHITSPTGTFYAEYSVPDAEELAERIAEGEFEDPHFYIPGAMQLFSLEFEGEFDGEVVLTIHYDDALLPAGFDESALVIYHFTDGNWKALESSVDTLNNTITFTTESLSPFTIGAVPEPATLGLFALASLSLLRRRR